jgi:hypothetical protein
VTGYPGFDDPHAREQIAPEREPAAPDLGLFARIEGMLREEQALLRIPARERSPYQHGRLRQIAAELDGVFERLRRRAERLA